MNDMIIENSIDAAELFINNELTEDELYSLLYQGYIDEEALNEAIEYFINEGYSDRNIMSNLYNVSAGQKRDNNDIVRNSMIQNPSMSRQYARIIQSGSGNRRIEQDRSMYNRMRNDYITSGQTAGIKTKLKPMLRSIGSSGDGSRILNNRRNFFQKYN